MVTKMRICSIHTCQPLNLLKVRVLQILTNFFESNCLWHILQLCKLRDGTLKLLTVAIGIRIQIEWSIVRIGHDYSEGGVSGLIALITSF